MAPVVKLDLNMGGTAQTNYSKNAKIGDKGTITLGIINYIPNEMLTYKITLNEVFTGNAERKTKICSQSFN